jgi:hypothetical protein
VGKFFENLKSGINEKKSDLKFSKSLKRLKDMEMSMPYSARRNVLAEVGETVPGAGISARAAGVSEAEYLAACESVLEGYWDSEKFSPEGILGSVGAQFNFFLIWCICKLDKPVDAAKFTQTLDWAIAQSGLEDIEIWSKSAKDGRDLNLFPEVIKGYRDRHLPRIVIETRLGEVRTKTEKLANLKSRSKNSTSLVYFIEGLRNSTIEGSRNFPDANLCRYIEYYNPDLIDKAYIAPLYGIHKSLKPDPKQIFENFLFCREGIIIAPDSNYGAPCVWVVKSKINKIICGYAYDALVTDGVTKYESHKIYLDFKYSTGGNRIGYQHIGSSKEEAISAIEAMHDRIDLLSDYYNIEWSDQIIDESKYYKTTTTTTTTYFAWD